MIENVNFSRFCDSFSDTYKNNFSYDGKRALFDYLEQLEEDTGEPIELDTVALCCEYSEYENFDELKKAYNNIETMEELENNTTVIKIDDDKFIIQNF